MTSATRTNEKLWQRIKNKVKSENTGGTKSGQWSARKALIAVRRYKAAGGRYKGPKSKSNSLTRWVRQDWTTKSGKPSHVTGERYLPRKAFKSLTKSELASVNKLKRRAMRQGKQFSRMPKRISQKVKRFRS